MKEARNGFLTVLGSMGEVHVLIDALYHSLFAAKVQI
jgi:hypothetical protein